jgi:hypothetical protein
MTPGASRIAGRGSLIRSLRALLGRVRRYGEHRAATSEEQRWAAEFYDGVDAVFRRALTPAATASLEVVDERRRRCCKTAGRTREGSTMDLPEQPAER